jgi:hypothetical protein
MRPNEKILTAHECVVTFARHQPTRAPLGRTTQRHGRQAEVPSEMHYGKWDTLDVSDDDDDEHNFYNGRPTGREGKESQRLLFRDEEALAGLRKLDKAAFEAFTSEHAAVIDAYASIDDDEASERIILMNPTTLLAPEANGFLLLRAMQLHSIGKVQRSEGITRQLLILSHIGDLARGMKGRDARDAVAPFFARMRSEASTGPYADARANFAAHLKLYIEHVAERAASSVQAAAKGSTTRLAQAAAAGRPAAGGAEGNRGVDSQRQDEQESESSPEGGGAEGLSLSAMARYFVLAAVVVLVAAAIHSAIDLSWSIN